MVATAKVQARNIERHTGADPGASLGIGVTVPLAGLYLKPKAVIKGVAPRFRELEIHFFTGSITFRVLHCYAHFIEDSHVIEAALGIEHLALAQAIAGTDLDFTLHDKRPRVIHAGN